MQAYLSEAGFDDFGFGRQTLSSESESVLQISHVATTDIAKFDVLQVVPDAFIGIQVRCIGRQPFQQDAMCGAFAQKGLDFVAAMNRRSIPDDQKLAGDGPQEFLQKPDYSTAIKGGRLHAQEEFAIRTDRTDHRIVVSCQFASQNGCFAFGSPGADHPRQ